MSRSETKDVESVEPAPSPPWIGWFPVAAAPVRSGCTQLAAALGIHVGLGVYSLC